MRIYNVTGYLIILCYMLACMYSAPTHLGPWIRMLIGAVYFIFCWFLGGLYLADVLHLGIAHRSLDYKEWFIKAVAVVNNTLYAVGGVGTDGTMLGTLEAYDPVTDAWTTKASLPVERYWPAAGAINGILYVVGGAGGEGFFRIGNGLGNVVIDFDKVRGVGSDVAIGGDDDGDGVADVIDAILSQDVVDGLAETGEVRRADDDHFS